MQSYQEQLRRTVKWKLLNFVLVCTRTLHSAAGVRLVKMSNMVTTGHGCVKEKQARRKLLEQTIMWKLFRLIWVYTNAVRRVVWNSTFKLITAADKLDCERGE